MKKNKLYEFNPQIYPRKLWVLFKPSYETINKLFHQDGKPLPFEQFDKMSRCQQNGSTMSVVSRETNDIGVVIIFWSKPKISTISHESVHACDYIFDELGMCTQSFEETNEPYAYLVGWVSGCIELVI